MANENQKNSKRLPGFYIALCCCVLVIGIAGYFTERSERGTSLDSDTNLTAQTNAVTDTDTNEGYPEGEVISVSEITPVEDTTPAPATAEPIPEPEPEYTLDNPDVMETAVQVNAEELYFAFPASGEILAPYSAQLSFNEALGDYRTHNGIDIAADEGCSISAAADGTVEDIFSDAYGDGISILHSNGIMTKYMCLGAIEDLQEGDTVKAGDVLGTVGKSKGENTKESHLHFEIYKDEQPIDPEEYLK